MKWILTALLALCLAACADTQPGALGSNNGANNAGDGQIGGDNPGGGNPGGGNPGGGNNPDGGEPQPREPYCDDADPETCDDDIDNDCDGLVDEGCTCTQPEKSCYSGDPADLDVRNTACRAGTQTCVQEFYTECMGEILPSEEICDGIDNDCNGVVDNIPGCENDPPVAICPEDQSGPPLANYAFLGGYEDPDGDAMARAAWRIADKPAGSTAEATPSDGLFAGIFADLHGIYVLELEVEDARGAIGRCTTRVETLTEDDLRIELTWNVGAPADKSDVDMHLLRAPGQRWFEEGSSGADCFYRNCRTCEDFQDEQGCRDQIAFFNDTGLVPPGRVTWFPPFADADDPRLDLDDVEGYGPENINIRAPKDGTYRLGIHYYAADGSGNAVANVKIFCGGDLAQEFEPTALMDMGGDDGGPQTEFWEVADIVWANGTCTVTPLGARNCRQICTRGVAEVGGCPAGQQRGQPCR